MSGRRRWQFLRLAPSAATTGGQIYCSPDGGDNWQAIAQTLAGTGPEVELEVAPPATTRALLTALEQKYPTLRRMPGHFSTVC